MSDYEAMQANQEKRRADLAAWQIEQDARNTQQLAALAARRGVIRSPYVRNPSQPEQPSVALSEPIDTEDDAVAVVVPKVKVKHKRSAS